jgi:polysaccharide export outer membrane protein
MTVKSRSRTIAERSVASAALFSVVLSSSLAFAQDSPSTTVRPAPKTEAPKPAAAATPGTPAGSIVPPPDYVIGPEDVLSIVYWREKDMTSDVTVRPDGRITLPLLDEVMAAGLTPTELRDRLTTESKRYFEDPNITVGVKEINSRKVFITGEVSKPGAYPLVGPMTVIQLIAMAGGLKDYADGSNITVIRTENGKQVSYRFDYKGVASRKVSLTTMIQLKAGDTVIVPE